MALVVDILSLPAVAHVLPLSMDEFEKLARANEELSVVYGGASSLMKLVVNAVLAVIGTATGERDVETRASKIMGANDFGIHPRQACMASSLEDLKRRLVISFVKVEFEKALEASHSVVQELDKHDSAIRIPPFIRERVGHRDGFFHAFLESLVARVLSQNRKISEIAFSVWCRYRGVY
mmetsp:Transcript_93789/g.148104  ORF Transcript_93789/g.148104 Transcript_93789/m.148104 type:complete len:179 (+) Transcript_93789:53-589(+)